jgi:hypothetical protein
LAEQIQRGRSEEQEAAGPSSLAPALVDEAAQDLQQAGETMNLVEDDELVLMACEIELRVCQPGTIRVGFKVEIEGGTLLADHARQGGLADLARAQKSSGGRSVQSLG